MSSTNYYSEFHGHKTTDLIVVHDHLRNFHKNNSNKSFDQHSKINIKPRKMIFLAGDSSLDNKYWFGSTSNALNGYETILKPPTSKLDVSYWMNKGLVDRGVGDEYVTLNCAVEESSIGDRSCCCLLPQDKFIGQHIQADDILVVSIGGNDVALKPTPFTVCNLLSLISCTTTECVSKLGCGTALPCDDYCMGGACGCVSNLLAFPCGLGYFIHLFKTRIEALISNILRYSNNKPKVIYVCMIYFPDQKVSGSWADIALSTMQYNTNPEKLKGFIRKVFELATKQINLYGIQVIGVPLYDILDGTNTSDYKVRVEPSVKGGEKMAKFILDYIFNAEGSSLSPVYTEMNR